MTNLDSTISALQSRITRRGQEIADLEGLYSYQRAVSYTRRQRRLAYAIREDIKPLANEQKLDRRVLRQLTDVRTNKNREQYLTFYLEEYPLLTVEKASQFGILLQSNKYSFG